MTKLNRWKLALAVCILGATVVAAPAQTLSTLVMFDGANGANPPFMSLVQGTDGNLYGVTQYGGANACSNGQGCGTVFRLTPAGVLESLYSFCSQANCEDGKYPQAGLTLGMDGNLYGTTSFAGDNEFCTIGCGTVFKISEAGTLTTIHTFTGQDGSLPIGALIQAVDGNFYGTTVEGGTGNYGTIFQMTPAGVLTTVYNFCEKTNCHDGDNPYGALVQATSGIFYGTTASGGYYCFGGCGTIFRITAGGKLTTLHSFDNVNGAYPFGGLIQASNGNLYGTASDTIFEITPQGTFTPLASFSGDSSAGMTLATDGNLYGTMYEGGDFGLGAIFNVTLTGGLTTLYSFCLQTNCSDGQLPYGGLLQATGGNFYGTTNSGGNDTCVTGGCGTVFSLDMGLGPFVSFVHDFAAVGKTAGVLGQGFTRATSVSFNGIPATFTVRRNTFLIATVPAGATTGYVTVTAPSGTLTSNVPFHVLP